MTYFMNDVYVDQRRRKGSMRSSRHTDWGSFPGSWLSVALASAARLYREWIQVGLEHTAIKALLTWTFLCCLSMSDAGGWLPSLPSPPNE
jgi:hypothetical protein